MDNVVPEVITNVHAPFSPSGFKRKKLCPGSHLAEIPHPNKSSEAAVDGTHTHTLVEICLINGDESAEIYVGQMLTDNEGEFVVKSDRAQRANMALLYVKNQVTLSAYEVIVTPEQRVNPGALIFRDDWYGTGDITMVAIEDYEEGKAYDASQIKWINVSDYKDGGQPVDPVNNYQGVSYMLGVIADLNPPFSTPIRFTIIQPKSGGIKEWDTTVGDLVTTWLPECQQIIENSLLADAPRVAGDEQCNYCLDRKNCETRNSTVVDGINSAMATVPMVTRSEIDVIDFTGGVVTDFPVVDVPITPLLPTALPVIMEMSNDVIGKIKMLAPIVRGWLKDIDDEALQRVLDGADIPDHKLIQKNGRRSWLGDQSAIMKSLLAMTANKERIFKKADIVEENLISFAKVLANQKLTEPQKKRINNEFIKKPQGKKALVLSTEKGEDISPSALLRNVEMPVVTMQNNDTK